MCKLTTKPALLVSRSSCCNRDGTLAEFDSHKPALQWLGCKHDRRHQSRFVGAVVRRAVPLVSGGRP